MCVGGGACGREGTCGVVGIIGEGAVVEAESGGMSGEFAAEIVALCTVRISFRANKCKNSSSKIGNRKTNKIKTADILAGSKSLMVVVTCRWMDGWVKSRPQTMMMADEVMMMGKEAARTHLSLMHPGNLLEAVHCRPSMVRIIRIISCWHRVAICPTIIIASRFRRLYPQTDAIPSIFSPIFPAM